MLRWNDVDNTVSELILRDAKAGSRLVHLTATVWRVLQGLPHSPREPWVIQDKRTEGVSRASTTAGSSSGFGVDDVRVRNLRHSFASRTL